MRSSEGRQPNAKMDGLKPLLTYGKRRVGTLVLAAILLLGAWSHVFHLIAGFSVPGDCLVAGDLAQTVLSDTASDSAPCHDAAQCDHCKALVSASGLGIEPVTLQLTDAPPSVAALTTPRVTSTRATTHLTRGPPVL